MLVLLIFLFFQILFFKFIGADDLHSTESKRGVCSAGDSKKKNSEREKGKLGVLEYSKCVLKYISIRWLRKYIFWPHPSCYQSRSSRLQHSRRFQSVFFWVLLLLLLLKGFFSLPLYFLIFFSTWIMMQRPGTHDATAHRRAIIISKYYKLHKCCYVSFEIFEHALSCIYLCASV